MKKIYLVLACTLGSIGAFAQKDNVGIGTTKPDQSAVLDLNSTNKGLLIPRMSLQQRNAIQTPAQGLMVYQSDFLSGFYFFDGKEWKAMATGNENNSVAGTDGDWDLNGNNLTTTPNAFIGTTGAGQALVFKTQGLWSGKIDPVSQSVYMGFSSGYNNSASAVRNVGIGTSSMGSLASSISNATDNIGIGHEALSKISGGTNNLGIGTYALANATNSTENFGLGYAALANAQGNGNIAIGPNALTNLITGNNNLAIGRAAGVNKTGSENVYIGTDAGRSATSVTESNKLYIGSSLASNPLIKGDFSANNLRINSKTTGYLAVGDFDAATPMPTPVGYRLIVQDGILTEKIKVALKSSATDWADYVFAKEYKLMSLENVEQFTKVNKHLPNVPSADEMVKDGLDISKTSKMFIEKIEELTLYMIEMNKEIKALKAENEKLKK